MFDALRVYIRSDLVTNRYSRRESLELGLAGAALGAGRIAVSTAKTETAAEQKEANRMTAVSDFNKFGEELEKLLILRTSPVAVKMLEKENEHSMFMQPDFDRPDFYKELFKSWGLD
jgi:hypothetical protein